MERLRGSAIRPSQAALITLVIAAVGGGSWLLSAAESPVPVDGAIEWRQESPLRAAVQLLCLNYQFPTVHAGEIKTYLLGVASGLSMIVLSIAAFVRSPADSEVESPADSATGTGNTTREVHRRHFGPLRVAQLLVALYLLWSLASYHVSAAPELAIGGTILLAIHFLWAFALGRGLSAAAAKLAAGWIVAITAATALLALWYYYGRNPTLRAKFPFGNPNFLSACLIPGILLATATLGGLIQKSLHRRDPVSLIAIVATVTIAVLSLWAFYEADSRGPALGLVAGLAVLAFFKLRSKARFIPVAACLGALIAAGAYFGLARDAASPTGRSATIRFRLYSWRYALEMFLEKPFTGHGQGGFVLAGDYHAIKDVLDDPLALDTRMAHAHNEWLEIMADLGSVGILLILAALVLTLRAGMAAMRSLPTSELRWILAGLMASLVGLMVEECFGVGLRVSGVPTYFYTVLGLIWAIAGDPSGLGPVRWSAPRLVRHVAVVVGGLTGLASLVTTQYDFHSARTAFQVDTALKAGEYTAALQFASTASTRLSPQRALSSLHQLAEAHMLAAQASRDRAADRQRRASASEVPDRRLLELAAADRAISDEHCMEGSAVLKELVSKAPGLMDHGLLLYGFNMVQADNAAARGNREKEAQHRHEAASALERELLRQPFEPTIALAFLRAVGEPPAPDRMGTILARPLRHNRITADYVDFLAERESDSALSGLLAHAVAEAKRTIQHEPNAKTMAELSQTWVPELLRLRATVHFRSGDYGAATEVLELAVPFYEQFGGQAPIGAASCYAELADCQFFDRPDEPQHALHSAARALAMAPESLAGRRLQASVKQQMIDYDLAAGREDDAITLLKELAAKTVTEEMVMTELGVRYRAMCERLLHRRLALMLRQSPDDLMTKLEGWTRRAIELSPGDYGAHYLAADLAFHNGSCQEAVGHLRDALDRGLPPKAAMNFLRMAHSKEPGCEDLQSLEKELTKFTAGKEDSGDSEQGEQLPDGDP